MRNHYSLRLISGPFVTGLLLAVFFAAPARSDNQTRSNWTVNVSEGGLTPAPATDDDQAEIAVVGSTVHVIWVADEPGGPGASVIWYRRSRDNGKSWEPRVKLAASDSLLDNDYLSSRRMAVDTQNVVHVAWATRPANDTWKGVIQYRRSPDGGTTWDSVKTIYNSGQNGLFTSFVVASTDGVRTSIGFTVNNDRCLLLTTADGGQTFSTNSVFGTVTSDSRSLLDIKRAGDRTYVLYTGVTSLYSGIAKDYVSVVSDTGSVIGSYVVSVPAQDGNHHALIWQDYNYSPKLAVSGDNAYAVFTGLDANNVKRAFLRRFYNYGASLDPAVMTSADDADGSNIASTDVSVAANDSYAFMVYHLAGSDKIVLRRYNEAKQAPEAAQPLTTKAYYFTGAWYPTVIAGAAQSAYVMWNAATLTWSADSFNSRVMPVLDYPLDAMTASMRLKSAVGTDGVVHWVARGGFAGGKDQDIIYGRWAPAPPPGQVNKALSLTTSDSDRRYDTMQAPAADATTNFKNAMTMAVWVQVQPGGATTGTSDVLQPIVHKRENVWEWSGYLLGTHHAAPSRIPTAAITTTSNTYWVEPPSGQSVLTEGQWYHLAFTYDSTVTGNNLKLYVNGSLVAQTAASGTLATADGGLFVGKYGNWVLDDLSLWNRALSQAEIARIRTGPLQGTETGLALYYNFDDTTQALNNPAASGNLLFQETFVTSTVPQISGVPQAVSVDPPAGTGSYASYTFTFSDSIGWQSINVANILINNFIDGRNACFVAVVPSSSAVYLVDDAGDAGGPYQGMTLPGSGTVQNSQCSISGSGSSISGSGNTLTVTLAITFKPSFRGNKVMYLAARESGGANSNWQALGTCSVPGNVTPFGVWVGGVTPARSSGSGAQTYTFTFNDSNGWQDLGVMNVLINDALNGNQACYLAYSRQYNVLYLVNDGGTALLPGLTLNGAGSVNNSQCTVSGVGSSASGSGNTLTLTLNMTFPATFAGNRLIYAAARSNGDALNSGWQAVGSRTVQ